MSIEELIAWLTENTNEWILNVNPHEGTYETRQQYIKFRDEDWDPAWDEGENFYEVQAYPNTPISCYLVHGTDLRKTLEDMMACIVPHRRNGSLPMRFEKEK